MCDYRARAFHASHSASEGETRNQLKATHRGAHVSQWEPQATRGGQGNDSTEKEDVALALGWKGRDFQGKEETWALKWVGA